MSEGQQFPIFITARSDPNQRAFDEFVMNAERAGKRAGDALGRAMAGVKDTISQALSIPRNELGSLDLNIEQLRQMERESLAVANATRQYAEATKAAAIASGENYRARTEEIRAAFELARAEEASAAQLRAKVRVMEQVQTQLNQTASATDLVIGKNNELVRSMQNVARAANVAEQSQRNVNALSAPGLDPFRAASNNGATTSALAEMVRQQEVADRLRAEMDNLRRAEVGAAEGASMLAAAHRGTALEIGYATRSARESASVFEAMYREQEQAARSLDELRRAEVGAAEGAKILEATYRGTALEVGRTANSARESAAVFEKAFREQERMASGVSVEMQRLLQQIDPAAAAQMRFEQSTEMVNAALRQGIITQQQATQAMELLNAEFVRNAGSSGQMRMGMVQVGQQMQDVAISLYGGQRASVVFAQQIPQLAFALTSLEGSSNKAANRIGQIASLMSGPWSIAVVGLSAVIGGLIDRYILAGDEAEKSKGKTLTLVDALEKSRFGTDAARKALEEYNAEQDRARKSTEDMIKINLASAEARLKDALATRQQLAAQLAKADADALTAGQGMSGEEARYARVAAAQTANIARGRLSENAANIATIAEALGNLKIQDAVRDAKAAIDPIVAINNKYDDMAAAATRAAVGNERLTAALKGTLTQIGKSRERDLEAQRKSSGSSSGRADLADYGSPLRSYRTTGGFAEQRKDRLHAGLDMAAPMGTPVYAPQAGTISFAALAGAYGNLIKMNHGGGTETRFGHLSQFAVGKGQQVNKGDLIGYVGSTGRSTGAHLHYEVRVNGKPVDPSKGKFPFDASKVAEEGQKARDAAQQAAEQMQRFAESSAEKVARINERFDEQPRLIDQANAATRELEQTMADVEDQLVNNASLTDEQRAILVQTYKDAQKGVVTIQDSLVRPYRQLAEDAQRRVEIERLLAQGREDEAEAVQIIWQYEQRNADLTEQQKTNILDMVRAERAVTEELRARQQVIGYYLDATRSVKQELVSIFSGNGSFGNLQSVFRNLNAQVMVEQIFGPMFRDLDKWVKEQSGVTSSVDFFADETKRAGDSAKSVADAFNDAAQRIRNPGAAGSAGSGLDSLIGSIGGGVNRAAIKNGLFGAAFGGAANDNGLSRIIEDLRTPDITVMGRSLKQSGTALGLDPERYFSEMQARLAKPITEAIATLGIMLPGKIGGVLSGAVVGNMVGGPLGAGLSLLDSIGIGGGGLLGKALPGFQTSGLVDGLAKSLGIGFSSTGSQVGGALGSFLPIPGGSIIGSVVGGLLGKIKLSKGVSAGLGGLFGAAGSIALGIPMLGPLGILAGLLLGHKAKYGNAVLGNSGMTISQNDKKLVEDATTAGNDVTGSLDKIMEALGASLGNYAVSIGQTDGKWRISTSGRSGELKSKYSDVQVFGKGDEAYQKAVEAAVRDAISDGAITGITQAAQNILKAGGDLQKAIEKAALIQSIPKQLKQITDPVGYAVDELNAEFRKIVSALTEGSASAAEFADAQKLYDLKRAEAIKQASEQMTSALRGLLNDLTTGNDALSLRERQTSAVAKYDPLRARVEAGDATAFNDFADAARALLDIERQMFGSQSGYFDRLAEVTGISRTALAGQDALISGASGAASPFAANDNLTGSIDSQTGVLVNGFTGLESQLAAVNQNLGALIAQGYGGAQSGYSFPTPYASYY
jgi:murein DD-endopeptidase MepM/ murein hydrolase activator NlpD